MANNRKGSPSPDLTNIGLMLARPDPQLAFKWVVKGSFPSGNVDASGKKIPTIGAQFIESIDVPFNNLEADSVFAGSGYNGFPVFHKLSAFSVNIYNDSDGRALSFIMMWKALIKSFDTGLYNLPKDYKATVTVVLLDTQNSPVIEIDLIGIWPADTSNFPLSQENSMLTLTQNFSVDNQTIRFMKK